MSAALLQRIDFLRLALNLGGNKKSIAHMLKLFLESVATSIDKLEEAEQSSNVLRWLQIMHQVKGAAQNITARRLVALCLEGEEIQSLPHPQSANVIYNMQKEFVLLREAIDQHLAAV